MTITEAAALHSMITDYMNQSLAFMTLYLSVVSAYLVVAYLVGKNLTKFQAGLVTTFFVVFSIHFTVSSYGSFEAAHLQHGKYFPDFVFGPSPIMNRTLAIFQVAVVFGCLKFMWDIRNGKTHD